MDENIRIVQRSEEPGIFILHQWMDRINLSTLALRATRKERVYLVKFSDVSAGGGVKPQGTKA